MLSIVVPVYNEEESLEAFYKEVNKELGGFGEKYEIVFVDDGSFDNSLTILKNLEKNDKNVRVYSFRKNQGKAEALTLGFQKSKGEIIVTLDADLQDKPSEIKKLLEKQKKDSIDVVSGWRKFRKDKSRMVIISRIYNFIAGKMFGVHLHDYNCGLKVYTREAAKSLRLYGGLHRFIPLLAYQLGFSVDEIVVEHEKRKFGKSKYGFSKIWKDLPDMFTMLFLTRYGKRPLHFFGIIGGLLVAVSIIILSYLSIVWFMGESIGRRPLLLFGILLMVIGIQIFFSGFIAELLISTTEREYRHASLKYSSDVE